MLSSIALLSIVALPTALALPVSASTATISTTPSTPFQTQQRTSCAIGVEQCQSILTKHSHHVCIDDLCHAACDNGYYRKASGLCLPFKIIQSSSSSTRSFGSSSTATATTDSASSTASSFSLSITDIISSTATDSSYQSSSTASASSSSNSTIDSASSSYSYGSSTYSGSATASSSSAVPTPTNVLVSSGITGFLSNNTGTASWYSTNRTIDSTNGTSWCGFPYNDTLPGFSASAGVMLNDFDGNYTAAAAAYCGLEANFTTSDGTVVQLYIVDAYDDEWLRTAGSVNIINGSFPLLNNGSAASNNSAVANATWVLTGLRNETYSFNGYGSGNVTVNVTLSSNSTSNSSSVTYGNSEASTVDSSLHSLANSTTTSNNSSSSNISSSPTLLSSAGVTGFLGTNVGIASWFRTDNVGDDTNGHSWCGYPYDNNLPGFAPSVGTMLKNFGGDYYAAATAYCGLEAEFTTPDGRTATLYIADGFDDKWVRTPGSIDVVTGSFPLLNGVQTSDKNVVVQNTQWKLTGRRNDRYKFNGQGSQSW